MLGVRHTLHVKKACLSLCPHLLCPRLWPWQKWKRLWQSSEHVISQFCQLCVYRCIHVWYDDNNDNNNSNNINIIIDIIILFFYAGNFTATVSWAGLVLLFSPKGFASRTSETGGLPGGVEGIHMHVYIYIYIWCMFEGTILGLRGEAKDHDVWGKRRWKSAMTSEVLISGVQYIYIYRERER